MTDLLTPEDTGDLAETRVIFHRTADTAVIHLPDNPTRRLTAPPPPPIQALRLADADARRAHDTGEIPLLGPTGAELAVAARPVPVPRPTRHALTARAGVHPVVRPRLRPRPEMQPRPPESVPAEVRAVVRRERRARRASVLVLATLVAAVLVLAVAW